MNIPVIILYASIIFLVYVVIIAYLAIKTATSEIIRCEPIDDTTESKIIQPGPNFDSIFETHLQSVDDENGCQVWTVKINK